MRNTKLTEFILTAILFWVAIITFIPGLIFADTAFTIQANTSTFIVWQDQLIPAVSANVANRIFNQSSSFLPNFNGGNSWLTEGDGNNTIWLGNCGIMNISNTTNYANCNTLPRFKIYNSTPVYSIYPLYPIIKYNISFLRDYVITQITPYFNNATPSFSAGANHVGFFRIFKNSTWTDTSNLTGESNIFVAPAPPINISGTVFEGLDETGGKVFYNQGGFTYAYDFGGAGCNPSPYQGYPLGYCPVNRPEIMAYIYYSRVVSGASYPLTDYFSLILSPQNGAGTPSGSLNNTFDGATGFFPPNLTGTYATYFQSSIFNETLNLSIKNTTLDFDFESGYAEVGQTFAGNKSIGLDFIYNSTSKLLILGTSSGGLVFPNVYDTNESLDLADVAPQVCPALNGVIGDSPNYAFDAVQFTDNLPKSHYPIICFDLRSEHNGKNFWGAIKVINNSLNTFRFQYAIFSPFIAPTGLPSAFTQPNATVPTALNRLADTGFCTPETCTYIFGWLILMLITFCAFFFGGFKIGITGFVTMLFAESIIGWLPQFLIIPVIVVASLIIVVIFRKSMFGQGTGN